ncbi:MAG: cupin domain-containing protein [Candidatus Marinimicrobia bacterium]|nr:cupin domain-containing protein [Candidatus Neomarinimicrobiota bacterium]
MIIKKTRNVEEEAIKVDGVKGITRQKLIAPPDGAPTFTMRKFTVEPGGYTYHHTHEYEHEIYVLNGKGLAKSEEGDITFEQDDVILVAPGETHQFINNSDEKLSFLCIIPNEE